MKVMIVTLFLKCFRALDESILKRSEKGLVEIRFMYGLRDFTWTSIKMVDDRPLRWPGMVIKPEPVLKRWGTLRENDS